jgi:prevent-host-death family protein
MIRANITEIKNRLSHYLRLVQGGEEIEIVDRKTPLARIVGISGLSSKGKGSQWVKKMRDLGIVMPPKKGKVSSDFSNIKNLASSEGQFCGALKALLDERDTGR